MAIFTRIPARERFHFGWTRSSSSFFRKCVVLDGICDSIQSGFALAARRLALAGVVLFAGMGLPAQAQIAFSNVDNPSSASDYAISGVPQFKLDEGTMAAPALQQFQRGAAATAAAAKAGIIVDLSRFRNWGGPQSPNVGSRTAVARTQAEWQNLWSSTDKGTAPLPLPQGTMGIGLFLGQRPSEAYSVRITTARKVEETDSILVTYTEYRPRNTSLTGRENQAKPPAPSSPWAIYLLPSSNGPIRFFKQTVAR